MYLQAQDGIEDNSSINLTDTGLSTGVRVRDERYFCIGNVASNVNLPTLLLLFWGGKKFVSK